MNEGIIIGVLSIIGSLYVFYAKIKKNIIDGEETKNKPIIELNQSIIELNSTIKYLIEDVKSLKDRVATHGKEIETLKTDVEKLKTKMNIYHEHS